jgi:alpha-N-acetylglucosaminidase
LIHYTTRRRFLGAAGTALISQLVPRSASPANESPGVSARAEAAEAVLERILPKHHSQIHLSLVAGRAEEQFQITGGAGNVAIAGSSQSSLLMGAHWYLKYVAGVSTSWNGNCLNRLPSTLPGPSSPIVCSANVPHRYALNDCNDGYTGPYWTWEEWEHQIDVLALHGINEVLVYIGAEAVYQQAFRRFRIPGEELRAWFPTPAHQPWWLLENMSGWVGPSVSQKQIDDRLALARKIADRLRELGMVPVLPGYFGILPDGFAQRNPGARIIPQGKWLGMKRPDWLDPTSDLFPAVAAEFYRVQKELLGPSTMFKMDPLHEGGESGDVNITAAARAIDEQLQRAHPGAVWAILGWQNNPREQVLAGIADKNHVLILDGQSDRYAYRDREQQWNDTPYAFGTIWNFGGHTTIGANVGVWNQRYFDQLTKPGSRLKGIAVMPEASCNNPAAFGYFTEMAWRKTRPDLAQWFSQWASYRYGGHDAHAARAWDTLRSTAYDMKSGQWSEAHDNLFSAQPSLTAKSACSWSPKEPRYDLKAFSFALGPLLQVDASLRSSPAYRYDLVDVARQTLANYSRVLLPEINRAFLDRDPSRFRELTKQWFGQIELLDRITATESSLLLGSWLAHAKRAATSPAEQEQCEFDACCLLLEWGPEASRDSGIHDYANREWNGLLAYYRRRWERYFSMQEDELEKKQPAGAIDWFAMDAVYAKESKNLPDEPIGDSYAVIRTIYEQGVARGIGKPSRKSPLTE